ncbi:MAG: hypothetical protein IJM81_03975 [Prevotella sp.]|nr:hypothetical protein [Prevotella sp.]
MEREKVIETDTLRAEQQLRQQFGCANPFHVPEGYFDHVADQIISQLSRQESGTADVVVMKPSFWKRFRSAMVAASCLIVGIFALNFFLNVPQKDEHQPVHAQVYSQSSEGSEMDFDADYALLDNEDIYAYVSGY